jgi:transcriptional regulator with XRE-family HTH domain
VTDEKTDTLGERIAFARERAGLSTAQLARRLGVKTRTLANWEREVTVPRTNRLVMLAQFLNVTPAWLLEGEADYAPQAVRPGIAQIKERLEQARGTIEGLSHLVEDLEQLLEDALQDEARRRDVA